MRAKKPDKILIRGPNWVGDAVLAIPAMKAVRALFADAEITLLVRPFSRTLRSRAIHRQGVERSQTIESGRLDSHYPRHQKPSIRHRAFAAEFFRIRPHDASGGRAATCRLCNRGTAVDADERRHCRLKIVSSNAILS